MNPPYAYILTGQGQSPAVFTWPNVAKKYIRDTYADSGGALHLPPEGFLSLQRHKVNPRAGRPPVIDTLDIASFLAP